MATVTGTFGGGAAGPQYRLRMECWQSTPGNGVYQVWVDKLSGSGYAGSDGYSGVAYVAGVAYGYSGSSYNFRNNPSIKVAEGWFSAQGVVSFRATADFPQSSLGDASTSTGSVDIGGVTPPPVDPPPKPNIPIIDSVTPTTILVASHRPTAPLLEYRFQWDDDGTFSTPLGTVNNDGYLYRILDLDQSTRYFIRTQVRNAGGWSPWSDAAQATTLGVAVSDGTSWKPAPVFESDGAAWAPALVQGSNASAWTPAG